MMRVQPYPAQGYLMAEQGDRGIGGITIGGIVVIVGIVVMLFWSIVIGLIIAPIGLIASAVSRKANGTEPLDAIHRRQREGQDTTSCMRWLPW